MENLKTPEKEQTNRFFYQNTKCLLKTIFNAKNERKRKLAMTFVKGIIPAVFILLAATFILKIIIDFITGEVDIKTVLISFFVFVTINFVLQVMAYKSERNDL